MISSQQMDDVEGKFNKKLYDECVNANSVYVPVKVNYRAPYYNKVVHGGCHGSVINFTTSQKDAVLSTIHRAYRVPEPEHKDLDEYYEDFFSFMNHTLLRPFKKGDRNIWVDPNIAGNQAMFTLIGSRQPWEDKTFMPAYKLAVRYFHPIVANWLAHHVKYTLFYRVVMTSDHDLFEEYLCTDRLVKAIKDPFTMHSNGSSFNGKDKRGVVAIFRGGSRKHFLGRSFPKALKHIETKRVPDGWGGYVEKADPMKVMHTLIMATHEEIDQIPQEYRELIRK